MITIAARSPEVERREDLAEAAEVGEVAGGQVVLALDLASS